VKEKHCRPELEFECVSPADSLTLTSYVVATGAVGTERGRRSMSLLLDLFTDDERPALSWSSSFEDESELAVDRMFLLVTLLVRGFSVKAFKINSSEYKQTHESGLQILLHFLKPSTQVLERFQVFFVVF